MLHVTFHTWLRYGAPSNVSEPLPTITLHATTEALLMATGKLDEMTNLHVKIRLAVKQALDEKARQDRRTLAATVDIALEEWLASREAAEKKRKN
jgi:hypothetical protein